MITFFFANAASDGLLAKREEVETYQRLADRRHSGPVQRVAGYYMRVLRKVFLKCLFLGCLDARLAGYDSVQLCRCTTQYSTTIRKEYQQQQDGSRKRAKKPLTWTELLHNSTNEFCLDRVDDEIRGTGDTMAIAIDGHRSHVGILGLQGIIFFR